MYELMESHRNTYLSDMHFENVTVTDKQLKSIYCPTSIRKIIANQELAALNITVTTFCEYIQYNFVTGYNGNIYAWFKAIHNSNYTTIVLED